MLPFVANHLLVRDRSVCWSPAHLFLVFAFFVMLGSRWLKDYLLAFTAESWLIALLSFSRKGLESGT